MDPQVDGPTSALTTQTTNDDCVLEAKDLAILAQLDTEENLDDLIADLEAEDGKDHDPEVLTIGHTRSVPDSVRNTSIDTGLNDLQVETYRRKYGWNTLKEERRSNYTKFFMQFVGPVQGVMEASSLFEFMMTLIQL